MRLKSDFKDYYDGLLANDEDRETLYLRRREEIEQGDIGSGHHFPTISLNSVVCDVIKYSTHTIGFCGKIYGAIKLEASVRHQKVSCMAFSIEDVDWFVQQNFSAAEFEGYNKIKNYWDKYHKWCHCHSRSAFFSYFENIDKLKDD